MQRYAAFLRAINVGGHTVKMDQLRRLFEAMKFSNVETFIASGNVLFETASADAPALEKRIAASLRTGLGYEVATFLRTDAELRAIARYKPFPQSQLDAATAFNIAFLAGPLDPGLRRKVMALKTEIDDFHIRGRELYWLSKVKQSQSTFSNALLEKILGKPSTIRGAETVRKLAAKY